MFHDAYEMQHWGPKQTLKNFWIENHDVSVKLLSSGILKILDTAFDIYYWRSVIKCNYNDFASKDRIMSTRLYQNI